MYDTVMVQCPYCWQWVELVLDVDVSGELVHDCEVCCQPWLVRVVRLSSAPDTPPQVQVSRAQ
ncbi:MAG: CPXCG motif-containing cysteine-rich protein [Myxococcota bacterium]